MKLAIKILLSLVLFSMQTAIFADEEDVKVYRPYPVVFVHGFNSSRETAWVETQTIPKFRPYYDKYDFIVPNQYLPYFSYGLDNHGDCRKIARSLKNVIDSSIYTMSYMNPPVPQNERKVIIVCHSFGGLVTRYMLNLLNSQHVYKVVFLGTPQIGSPLASAGWLVYDNTTENSSLKQVRDVYKSWAQNLNGALSSNETKAYANLVEKINEVITWDKTFVKKIKKTGIQLDKPCIEQMRVPATVRSETKLEGTGGYFPPVTIPYTHVNSYEGANTFLATTELTIPNNRRTVYGAGGFGSWFIEWATRTLILDSPHTLKGFPQGNSMQDLDAGDGVVTLKSQQELGKNYFVNAYHMGETEEFDTILKAIDDEPPEVTKIEAVPADWKGWNSDKDENAKNRNKFYIVIGIKEYLLADIEILELTLDNKPITITSRKPYEWYPDKEFVMERKAPFKSGDGTPYKLKPGEFYIEVDMLPGVHNLKIKIQNPAKKTTTAKQKFDRPNINSIDVSPRWTVDIGTEKPHPGSLSFKVNTGVLKKAKVTAEVYVYKIKKGTVKRKSYSSCGEFDAEIEVEEEMEFIVPVPDKKIYLFTSGLYMSNDGCIDFSDLTWSGSGNSGVGGKYPLLIRAELESADNVQGLAYTNWQDDKGWENDVISITKVVKGDPTFMQVSYTANSKYEYALYEIEKIQREYKNQVEDMINSKLYSDVNLENWTAKLKANGANKREIASLVLQRKQDIYLQLEGQIKQLEKIKNAKIESMWLGLAVDAQNDENKAFTNSMEKQLNLKYTNSISSNVLRPAFQQQLN